MSLSLIVRSIGDSGLGLFATHVGLMIGSSMRKELGGGEEDSADNHLSVIHQEEVSSWKRLLENELDCGQL